MGVVNVTPDSFSDGGEWFEPDAAVAHGLRAASRRAPTCSTSAASPPGPAPSGRPQRRSCAASSRSWQRSRGGARVSVDTMRAEVAARAARGRRRLVNDVSGGLADPEMAAVVADSGRAVRRHALARRTARTCSPGRRTTTSSSDVCRELPRRVEDLGAGGVRREQIVLDPGLGFAKLAGAQLAPAGPPRPVQALGHPVLVGTSRKRSSAGWACRRAPRPGRRPSATPPPRRPRCRRGSAGAWGVRVHHVPSSLDALRVVAAMEAAR